MSKSTGVEKTKKMVTKPGKELKHGKHMGHGTEVSGPAAKGVKSKGVPSGKHMPDKSIYSMKNRQVEGFIAARHLKITPGGGMGIPKP
jgi:hypothetical protein